LSSVEKGAKAMAKRDGRDVSEIAVATRMFSEAKSASDVVARQLRENASLVTRIGVELRERKPRIVVTCARGSSDHAATYGKYLIETHAGVLTSSFAPSVSSVYMAKQNMQGAIFLALSQSGKSPDLIASAKAAKEAGALVIALVNVVHSPLAELADEVIPLHAGDEKSIAATKSYIATLVALAHLVAAWRNDNGLIQALSLLPAQLKEAWDLDWHAAIDALETANNFFVVGRGVGLAVAQESALKFKEVAGLHAEAYSSAEVRHGPMAIVKPGFPVFLYTQDDGTRQGFDQVVKDFIDCGAVVIVAGKEYAGAINLPVPAGLAAPTAPIVFIQSFYRMVNALSVLRGYDPDSPPHLRKITETL
jgi:glucosamine--fructose-6-phosphate aminotransferase (isomerizing)